MYKSMAGMLLAFVQAAGGEQVEDPIRLRVLWSTDVTPRMLDLAEAGLRRIFGSVGIETRWVDCPLDVTGLVRTDECDDDLTPLDVWIRLLPVTHVAGIPHNSLGWSLPMSNGSFGAYAAIHLGAVARQAGTEERRAEVMTYAIAHEVGHLLLGPGNHGLTGIMARQWNPGHLKQPQTFLTFTSGERARLLRATDERRRAFAASRSRIAESRSKRRRSETVGIPVINQN